MVNKNKKPIQFRLIEVKKLSYFENDPFAIGLKVKKIKNSNVEYSASVNVDKELEAMSIRTMAKFSIEREGKKYDLFGIEVKHVFKIRYFSEVVQISKENTFKIPDHLMLTFINVSISGMRGMIAILNTRPEYNQLYFPIINSANLLKEIKQQD